MNTRLILTCKIQVDIRHLITLKTEKCFERNAESLLGQRLATGGTQFVRQVNAARILIVPLNVPIIRAEIVRGQRIYFGNIRGKCRKGRTDRTARADQISVRQ